MTSFLNKIIFALAGKPAGVSKNAVKLSQNRIEDELQLKARRCTLFAVLQGR